jgi:site-specific DNA recombinase
VRRYARVSTDRQAERGVSLEAQAEKIRAMAVVHSAEVLDIIVDGGESAKSLQRPGIDRLLALVDAKKVDSVIVAKLDRLTRSVKDLCELLERFEHRVWLPIQMGTERPPIPGGLFCSF